MTHVLRFQNSSKLRIQKWDCFEFIIIIYILLSTFKVNKWKESSSEVLYLFLPSSSNIRKTAFRFWLVVATFLRFNVVVLHMEQCVAYHPYHCFIPSVNIIKKVKITAIGKAFHHDGEHTSHRPTCPYIRIPSSTTRF